MTGPRQKGYTIKNAFSEVTNDMLVVLLRTTEGKAFIKAVAEARRRGWELNPEWNAMTPEQLLSWQSGMMMNPCPKCSGRPDLDTYEGYEGPVSVVRCTCCQFQTSAFFEDKMAVDAWNRGRGL